MAAAHTNMFDLHTHVLPRLDDGAADFDDSLAIAREAAACGVSTLVATPHVRDDYPTTPAQLSSRLVEVRAALAEARIDVAVFPGAEVALDVVRASSLAELAPFVLGGESAHLLVEPPFFGWPLDLIDEIHRLRAGGLAVVLAHPERNSAVQESPRRLAQLVDDGALLQVTAGSIVGAFGQAAARAAKELLAAGLVHLVSTDTHRAGGRGATLPHALSSIGDPELVSWLMVDVPQAILSRRPRPDRPPTRRRWRTPRRPALHRA
jgi:protein-tyrosine phosphatase